MPCLQVQVTAAAPAPQLRVHSDPLPQPKRGELLIEVAAASVNPIDARRSQGYGRCLLRLKKAARFPIAMGNDFAGTVREVGAGTTGFAVGQRLFGLKATGPAGTHASHIVADARFVRPAHPGIDLVELAVLPYSFTTMLQAVQGCGLGSHNAPGKAVLVAGASGGLGQLALQVLVDWGARTTAIAETATVELCRGLGAQEVVDRLAAPLEQLPAHYDAVLNFASWELDSLLASRLKPGALGYSTTVHPLLGNFDKLGLLRGALRTAADKRQGSAVVRAAAPGARYHWTVLSPDSAALDLLQSGLAQGRYRLPVGLRVPPERAAEAFTHALRGRPGRAAIVFTP